MESEHGTVSDLKKHLVATVDGVDQRHPVAAADGGDLSTPHNRSGSSSSSSSTTSDSSSKDPLQVDAEEPRNSIASSSGPPKLVEDTQLVSEHGENKVPGISTPKQEQYNELPEPTSLPTENFDRTPETSLDNVSATQSPPVQVMERPGEPAPYKIPSSVFARTNTTTPMKWSITSNESLFSIHMGNMSFTKDQYPWFAKSGELGRLGDPTMSGHFVNFSSNCLPTNKATDVGIKSGNLGEGLGITEAAVETMKEVLRENANQLSKEKLSLSDYVPYSPRFSQYSDESTASHESFPFPILTGEGAKSGSVEKIQEKQEPPLLSETETSAATPDAAQTSWFSCFSSCPCRS